MLSLAIESPGFSWVHVKYREFAPILLSGVLGLLLAFVPCGRVALSPIS